MQTDLVLRQLGSRHLGNKRLIGKLGESHFHYISAASVVRLWIGLNFIYLFLFIYN